MAGLFAPTSRYAKAATYKARLPTGGTADAIVIPVPRSAAPVGFHPRAVGDRLDLIAARYLADPRGFWRLCDANDSLVAGALERRELIGVPQAGS